MRTTRLRMFGALLAAVVSTAIAATPASAAPAPPPFGSADTDAGTDAELTFDVGGLTLHAGMRTPDRPRPEVAVLLLPGSGPTDRDGNQPGLPANTIRRIADDLAAQGIASLRFDKFGSGATGLAGLPVERVGEYGFTDQVDHAAAAAAVLAERTGIPVERLVVVGHSEGALTALALAQRGIGHGGLGLLAPLPMRYLDLLSAQLNTQLDAGVRSGQLPAQDADHARTALRESVESLRGTGALPPDRDPYLASIGFVDANAKFLAEADALDPVALASTVPVRTPTLVTCSDKDLNVSCDQVAALRDALGDTDLRFARLANANHLLGELGPFPPSPLDQLVPLPQSAEFTAALHEWSRSLTA